MVPSVRFLLAIMCFLATLIQYTQRINMSVAIVCMVNHTAVDLTHVAEFDQSHFNQSLILNEVDDSKCYNLKTENAIKPLVSKILKLLNRCKCLLMLENCFFFIFLDLKMQ